MRDAEPQVAGHTDAVFQEHYNQRAAQSNHVLVNMLQENRDTLAPLKSLPTKACIGNDRELRFNIFQDEAERDKANKLQKSKEVGGLHKKQPISPAVKDQFIRAALDLDPQWIAKLETLTESKWKALTFKLICQEGKCGNMLRQCLKKIMEGGGQGATRYSFRHHMQQKIDEKVRSGLKVTERDLDRVYQVFYIK